MIKQAYVDGFKYTCSRNGIDPHVLLKNASLTYWNDYESSFDDPIYGELGRKVYKGLWGIPFLFPSQRRMSVNPGDSYESLSKGTGVSVDELRRLNGYKPLIAGSVFRLPNARKK